MGQPGLGQQPLPTHLRHDPQGHPDEPYLRWAVKNEWGLALNVSRWRMRKLKGVPFQETKRKSFPFVAWGYYQGFAAMALNVTYGYVVGDVSDKSGGAIKHSDSVVCVVLEVPAALPEITVDHKYSFGQALGDALKLDNVQKVFRTRGVRIEGHWGADECYVAASDKEFAQRFLVPSVFDTLVRPYGGLNGADVIGFWFRFVGNKVILWASLNQGNKEIIGKCLAKAVDLYQSVPLQARGELSGAPDGKGLPQVTELVSMITGHRQA